MGTAALADPPPAPPRRAVVHPDLGPGERRVLRGVMWDDYVRLSDDSERTKIKSTFDGPAGLLEIERPQGAVHESVSRLLFSLVLAFARETNRDLWPSGSVAVRREDLDRGCEPDESSYLSEDRLPPTGTNLLDLAGGHLPPDLVIEVDVTNPGVSKLPIDAALGIPEVWVWRRETLTGRRLTDAGRYEVVADSLGLPGFPFPLAAELLARRPWGLLALERAFLERLRGG